MKKISLIGSTGSIGRQVVEVVKNHPDEYKIVGVAAFGDRETFARQTEILKPEICVLAYACFGRLLGGCALRALKAQRGSQAGFCDAVCLCPFLGVGASFVFEEVLKPYASRAGHPALGSARA